jgi:hypothetical protein
MKESKTIGSYWKHKGEWFILPCPKLMFEKSKDCNYLTFEISWLCFTAYWSLKFLKAKNEITEVTIGI